MNALRNPLFRTVTIVALACGFLISAAPTTPAQDQNGIVINMSDLADPIYPFFAYPLNFTISVGCGAVVRAAAANQEAHANVVVSGTGPAWLTIQGAQVEFDPADCSPTNTGILTAPGTATVTANFTAPGLVATTFTFTATVDGAVPATSDTDTTPITVAYFPGYSFSTDGLFPIEVVNGTASFNATARVTANAETMVMFMIDQGPAFGNLTGLPDSRLFMYPHPDNGTETLEEFVITYEAGPDFVSDTVVISTFSHANADPTLMTEKQTLTWTFVAPGGSLPGVNETSGATDDGKGGIPGPEVVLVVAGVLAAVAVARRRWD